MYLIEIHSALLFMNVMSKNFKCKYAIFGQPSNLITNIIATTMTKSKNELINFSNEIKNMAEKHEIILESVCL